MKIAIAKGRIFDETLSLLNSIGIKPNYDQIKQRKLIVNTNQKTIDIVIIRASDIPTYVSNNAVELGVVGKDTLIENELHLTNLVELLDLKIAQCRLLLAGKNNDTFKTIQPRTTYKVATKYTSITQRFFAQYHANVRLLKLYGSMELAPIMNLSDYIVDIVSSGQTLKINGLKPLMDIHRSSARLITNKTALCFHSKPMHKLIQQLQPCVN